MNTILRRQYKSFDFVLALMIVILAMCGLVMLGSATRIDISGAYGLYSKQKLWLASGLALMLAAAFVDYHFICRFYIPIYVLSIVLLGTIFFLANNINNTFRWFGVMGQSVQPSEFAKVFSIIFLATFIDKHSEKIEKLPFFLALIGLALLPAALVYLQPSLSAAGVILVISAVVIFAGGIPYRNILILLLFLAPAVTFLYTDFMSEDRVIIDKVMQDYQIERIEKMLDPSLDAEATSQLERSKYAIGSGQLYGKGLYGGTHGYGTAESENDFIFAVLGEEFGFVGCAFIIVLMFLIIIKCLYTAATAADTQGRLIASGAAAMFFFQSFFHVGVTIGIMPVTGVTFPFFSYGGSSMWTCMIAAGLVINVGMTKSKSMFED